MEILLTDEIQSNFEIDYTADVEIKKQSLKLYKSQMDTKTIDKIFESIKVKDKYLEKYFYLKLSW
jgi:hypothetical protein